MARNYVLSDASLMECLVIHETLRRIKSEILSGQPSGGVIDAAIMECLKVASAGTTF